MRWGFENPPAYAEAILQQIEQGADAVVPVLWLYEVSGVLARAQLKGHLTATSVQDFLDDLKDLDITIDDESAERVLTDVHQTALTYCLTSYDASYLELALRRRIPLATLDTELRDACKLAGVSVQPAKL